MKNANRLLFVGHPGRTLALHFRQALADEPKSSTNVRFMAPRQLLRMAGMGAKLTRLGLARELISRSKAGLRPSFNLAFPHFQPRHDPISGRGFQPYHEPVLAMVVQGSVGGSAVPACNSSMEMPSGVRMKAMRPSRGGRLIVTPRAMKALQVS